MSPHDPPQGGWGDRIKDMPLRDRSFITLLSPPKGSNRKTVRPPPGGSQMTLVFLCKILGKIFLCKYWENTFPPKNILENILKST